MERATIGRLVHYTLTAKNAAAVNRRRTDSGAIAGRLQQNPPQWPAGAQAHIGLEASEGDVLPLLVVSVWPTGLVNGQVFLDGNDTLYVTDVPARKSAVESGAWHWPTGTAEATLNDA